MTDQADQADQAEDPATARFVAHRNLLFTVAYEMLGSATDAEDVLQETWLRWVRVDLAAVRDPRAYLVRVTTRQALNRLRARQRRRESYVGSWLPEPMLTAPDVAEDVLLAERVDGPDGSCSRACRRPSGPCSCCARCSTWATTRSRRRSRRPRRLSDRSPTARVSPSSPRGRHRRPDPGGVRRAALRPVLGVEKVVRYLTGLLARTEQPVSAAPAELNGSPALVVRLDGQVDGVIAVSVEAGRVIGLYYVRNPEKPSRVGSETALTLR